jgi:hypothetical protein
MSLPRTARVRALACRVALGALLAGCDSGPGQIIARVPSPDGRADALLVREEDCGATCDTAHGVYLVARGGALPEGLERAQLFLNDAKGVRVRWRDPHMLLVEYDRAVVHGFRNRWYLDVRPSEPGERFHLVEVRLAPTDSVSFPPVE